MNNEAISGELGIAVQTVRNYVSTIYDELGVHSKGEAIIWVENVACLDRREGLKRPDLLRPE